MLTKPSDLEGHSIGFLEDKRRMNVALSRAKQVLIIIGNLEVWTEEQRLCIYRRTIAKVLSTLLDDVVARGDVLLWAGGQTIMVVAKLPNCRYISHVNTTKFSDKLHPSSLPRI